MASPDVAHIFSRCHATAGGHAVYDYDRFSELAGPVTAAPAGPEPYRVRYRRVLTRRQRLQVLPLAAGNLLLASVFFGWLLVPSHYPDSSNLSTAVAVGNAVMFGCIALIEGLRLLSSFALSWFAWRTQDPVPVAPEAGVRVAFTTTIVPSKEPLRMVRRTLLAMTRVRHGGPFDVWLLDEGDDPAVRRMCAALGVRHFTRHGIERWNTAGGAFAAKTKHGNHNAWLDAHGDGYDIEISVDPDHVPLPNMAERMLGYFRDPDVAFVVGPQVYGNGTRFLTRAAESQAYLFQSVIQRAGNRGGAGMFVGTNHAYRISTWRQIGGFHASVTEDMATSLVVHGTRNPATGRYWTSVYTPDVVAVGEGPTTWTDYLNQQLRWARGVDDLAVSGLWRRMRALPRGRRLHYALLLAYYPSAAMSWLLGIGLTVTYMTLGSSGITVDIPAWWALYVDVAAVQLALYFWLRRLNVSPHEVEGSAGLSGMAVGAFAAPAYVAALVGAVLRRPVGFVVTPKGSAASVDHLRAFRRHLGWSAVLVAALGCAVALGHVYPANLLWAGLTLTACLTPVGVWLAAGGGPLRRRRPPAVPARVVRAATTAVRTTERVAS